MIDFEVGKIYRFIYDRVGSELLERVKVEYIVKVLEKFDDEVSCLVYSSRYDGFENHVGLDGSETYFMLKNVVSGGEVDFGLDTRWCMDIFEERVNLLLSEHSDDNIYFIGELSGIRSCLGVGIFLRRYRPDGLSFRFEVKNE